MTGGSEIDSVRQAIYDAIVTRGRVPAAAEVAQTCGISPEQAEDAFRALAAAHVIVLRPGTLDLWAAPPFSAVANGFRVRSGNRSLFGTCAWDAFGVPAALHADADVEASCPSSGQPIRCGVRRGRAFGDGVIHLLVPAARFWDDVIYT